MNRKPFSEVVLACKRLALRPTKDAPMQWYGDPVCFMLLDGPTNWSASFMALERICEAAAAEYGLEYLKHNATIVEAPTEEALAQVDVALMQLEEGREEDEESNVDPDQGTPGER